VVQQGFKVWDQTVEKHPYQEFPFLDKQSVENAQATLAQERKLEQSNPAMFKKVATYESSERQKQEQMELNQAKSMSKAIAEHPNAANAARKQAPKIIESGVTGDDSPGVKTLDPN